MLLIRALSVSISGASLSLIRIVCGDILLFYFDESKIKYALVVSMFGSAIGWSVYPSLIQYLMDSFGFSKSMYILASLMSVHVFAGLSFTETDCYGKRSTQEEHGEKARLLSDDGSSKPCSLNVDALAQDLSEKVHACQPSWIRFPMTSIF